MYKLIPSDDAPLTITAPEPGSYVNPVAEFTARLHAVTPDVFITPALLGINVIVFLAMLIGGVHAFEPSTDSLIRSGANFGPSTVTAGQWWRLLTSMFLHIGIVHLGFNMFVLMQVGPFVERLLGNIGFLIVYLVSGLAGALVSIAWNPYVVSAGASGAIFGLYGALLGFLLMSKRDSIPAEMLSTLSRSALVFIGYNAVFGVINEGTDVAAHVGGLAAGLLCGMLTSIPVDVEHTDGRFLRNAAVLLGGAVLIAGTAAALPRPVDIRAEVQKFAELEKRTLAAYSSILNRARTDKLRDAQVADTLDREILPDWRREHDSLAKLTHLPYKQQQVITSVVQYMELRQEAWSLLAQGLRGHTIVLLQQASVKQREADNLAKKLSNPRH